MWDILDDEYGRPEDVATVAINMLMNFKTVKKTESEKFMEIFIAFTRAKVDLTEVRMLGDLDSAAMIMNLTGKLPSSACKARWIECRTKTQLRINHSQQ